MNYVLITKDSRFSFSNNKALKFENPVEKLYLEIDTTIYGVVQGVL